MTGTANLIGPTGIPAVPFIPFTTNPDGSFNFFDENLFTAGGKLYANVDAGTFNPATSAYTVVIPDHLYQIDPVTAHASLIAPATLGLSTFVSVNGIVYAFNGVAGQVDTFNLSNGNVSFVTNLDPAAGLIFGASPVPEPATIALAGIGIAAIIVSRLRRRG